MAIEERGASRLNELIVIVAEEVGEMIRVVRSA
jgi:hypothetical protein